MRTPENLDNTLLVVWSADHQCENLNRSSQLVPLSKSEMNGMKDQSDSHIWTKQGWKCISSYKALAPILSMCHGHNFFQVLRIWISFVLWSVKVNHSYQDRTGQGNSRHIHEVTTPFMPLPRGWVMKFYICHRVQRFEVRTKSRYRNWLSRQWTKCEPFKLSPLPSICTYIRGIEACVVHSSAGGLF